MDIKRVTCASVLALGVGVAGLSGGTGVASADPGPQPCGFPGCPAPGGPSWDHGGPDGPSPWDHPGPSPWDHPAPSAWDHRGPDGPSPWDHNPGWGPPPPELAWRSIDQARFDHQPFAYNGRWVTPIFEPGFNQWGFWFFGIWVPL